MNKPLHLTFIADTHHYSETLGVTGKAYERRAGADQKCLAETGGIIDAAFQKIKKSDTDAVMIIGDLSNDGERVSHMEFIKKLRDLQKEKRVYVCVATHDWCCDKNARRYSDDTVYHDVDTVSSKELREMYFDFGAENAKDEFVTHLGTSSYLVELTNDVSLLALNDDQNGKGKAGFKPDHLKWITDTIKAQTAKGKTVIAMEHHLLYPHISKIITGGACCGDNFELMEAFADAGLRFVFVGHSHIQRIDKFVSKNGNELYEINVGSLVGYPAPIVNVTADSENIYINTEHLKEFTYHGTVYTLDYLKRHATNIVTRILYSAKNNCTADFIKNTAELGLAAKPSEILKPVLKHLAKKAPIVSVGAVGKKINCLLFNEKLNNKYLAVLDTVSISSVVDAFLLSVLDGEPQEHFSFVLTDVLCSASKIPQKVLNRLNIHKLDGALSEFSHMVNEITSGGELDNNNIIIKRYQK